MSRTTCRWTRNKNAEGHTLKAKRRGTCQTYRDAGPTKKGEHWGESAAKVRWYWECEIDGDYRVSRPMLTEGRALLEGCAYFERTIRK
jgi:hypothetical protein